MPAGLTPPQIDKLKALPFGWDVSQIRYGETGQVIVVIDNFSPNAKRLVEHSKTLIYKRMNPHYPGMQAPAPPQYLQPLFPAIGFILAHAFEQPGTMKFEACNFSYVTTPPDELSPFQRYPHYDGGSDRKIALLHYLCGPDQGGTNFYRHERTGWETVTRERDADFETARRADVQDHSLRRTGYFGESGDGYTLLKSVPAAFNRAIIYSSTTIHSGDLGEAPAFTTSPETGRLTVNSFLLPA